ncbi:unnamed protein product [Ambrosiozyma monospora]|uniref:Unnamed protein product n=1 Tax=Ambrosiozyma monospora TaxID=43982 RepID=A0ACB5TYF6_AMBMO|nr:unnamed protein product [Ambrosiozyma monospora]
MNCHQFAQLFEVENYHEGSYALDCQDINSDVAETSFPLYPFRFAGGRATERKMSKEGRILYGSSYLYANAPPADRIQFLGAGIDGSSVIIRTEVDDLTKKSVISKKDGSLFDMLRTVFYKEAKHVKKSLDSLYDYPNFLRLDNTVKQIESLYNTNIQRQPFFDSNDLVYDDSYLMKPSDDLEVMQSPWNTYQIHSS